MQSVILVQPGCICSSTDLYEQIWCSIPNEIKDYIRTSVGCGPALWFEILHGCVGLVGCQYWRLPSVRACGGGHNFILWEKEERENSRSAFYQNISPPSIHEIVPKTVTYLNKRHMRTRGRARLFVVVMCHWTQTLDSLVARLYKTA